jgi:hypothetical protein
LSVRGPEGALSLFTSTWSLSPAVATLLLSELGLRVPQPFQPSVPYTTLAGRERLRASTAAVDVDLRQVVTAFGDAPVAVMALGVVHGESLAARACWGSAAVLVTQDTRGWRFARRKPAALFAALAAITPDTPAAGGVPVTVPCGRDPDHNHNHHPEHDTVDIEGGSPLARAPMRGTPTSSAARRILDAPVVHSGMFVPVRDGEPQPAVHWRDTRAERTGHVVRHVVTSRTDSNGTRWMTYTPGDRSRLAAALRDAVTPLLRDERTAHE